MNDYHKRSSLPPKILGDPQYLEHLPRLQSFMARSRQLRHQPRELLDLQVEMAGALLGWQESQTRLEREAADYSGQDPEFLEEHEIAAGVAKRLAYIVRQIADGIAWRALNYHRAALYQLASKPQTGHLSLESTAHELRFAAAHVETSGNPVIINDLTNFLRFGDYTSIGPDGVTVAEVKGGEASAKSRRARRQRRALDSVLDFLNAGIRETREGSHRIHLFRVPPKTHLPTVRQLIREAKHKGDAHARLSDSLAVDVLYSTLLAEITEDEATPRLFRNPFAQSSDASSSHSLELFDRFSRNLAPYSIYPFADEDCTDIMTGALWLITHFNHGNLVRCLRRRGLVVALPTPQQLDAFSSMSHGERTRHEDDVAIWVYRANDPRRVHIYPALLGRVIWEFLDEESFADATEEILDQDPAEVAVLPAYAVAAFEKENELWD